MEEWKDWIGSTEKEFSLKLYSRTSWDLFRLALTFSLLGSMVLYPWSYSRNDGTERVFFCYIGLINTDFQWLNGFFLWYMTMIRLAVEVWRGSHFVVWNGVWSMNGSDRKALSHIVLSGIDHLHKWSVPKIFGQGGMDWDEDLEVARQFSLTYF